MFDEIVNSHRSEYVGQLTIDNNEYTLYICPICGDAKALGTERYKHLYTGDQTVSHSGFTGELVIGSVEVNA